MGGMVCPRPQRKGPTGGWVERGRGYTMTGPIRHLYRQFWVLLFLLQSHLFMIINIENMKRLYAYIFLRIGI